MLVVFGGVRADERSQLLEDSEMVAMAANLNRPTAHARPVYAPREATGSAFRDAMRELASGVCLLTSGSGDERSGLIAKSVSSLSADPPTLLVCVDRASSGCHAGDLHGEFAVSVLGADQREIADRFAVGSSLRGAGLFRDCRWGVLPGGAIYLAGSVAVFDCEAVERIDRHAHAIVIGHARRVLIGDGSGALVRWRGVYDQVGWSRDEIERAVGLSPRRAGTD